MNICKYVLRISSLAPEFLRRVKPKGPKYLYSRMWGFYIRNYYYDVGK